ncbi:MAG: hypothetical protein Q8P89_02035 [bacterium]|nr:hypothetical protein [bacterium]
MFHNQIMELSEEHKKEIKMKLMETIITSLEQGRLSNDELPGVASFILERMDTLKDQDELRFFLSELAAKWPIFTDILVGEIGVAREKEEEKAEGYVSELMKSGKLDEAVNLAKKVTDDSMR